MSARLLGLFTAPVAEFRDHQTRRADFHRTPPQCYPSLADDITWLSAREEGFVEDNLLQAGRRNATERVAMLLTHLYRRLDRTGQGVRYADGQLGSIECSINQQHIADTLGQSLVHTNKTLIGLQKPGLHALKNGRLQRLNTRALKRIADYYDAPARKVPLRWPVLRART